VSGTLLTQQPADQREGAGRILQQFTKRPEKGSFQNLEQHDERLSVAYDASRVRLCSDMNKIAIHAKRVAMDLE
jgi:hypothetical protein